MVVMTQSVLVISSGSEKFHEYDEASSEEKGNDSSSKASFNVLMQSGNQSQKRGEQDSGQSKWNFNQMHDKKQTSNMKVRRKPVEKDDENNQEKRLKELEKSTKEIKDSQKAVIDIVAGLSTTIENLKSGLMKELRRKRCEIEEFECKDNGKRKMGTDLTAAKTANHIPNTPAKKQMPKGRARRAGLTAGLRYASQNENVSLVKGVSGIMKKHGNAKRRMKMKNVVGDEEGSSWKIERKEMEIVETESEMSSTMSNRCRVKKGGWRGVSYGCASAVIHDFLMNMTRPLEENVVRIKGQTADRSHILSLLPCMEVETEVLNCFSALLTVRSRRNAGNAPNRVWYLPGWVGKKEETNNLTLDELYVGLLTEEKFGGNISECEKICIPLNWDGNHWYLAVVDMKAKRVLLFDSLPDKDFNDLRELHAQLLCYRIDGALSAGLEDKYTYDITKFEYSHPSWCPKQINKWDCAIFVMKYMEMCDEMKEGIKLEILSNEARRLRAVELFVDAANEVRGNCIDEFHALQEIFQI